MYIWCIHGRKESQGLLMLSSSYESQGLLMLSSERFNMNKTSL